MKLFELDEMLRALCPVDGISCEGRIDFKQEATPEQRALAEQLMQTYLPQVDLRGFP